MILKLEGGTGYSVGLRSPIKKELGFFVDFSKARRLVKKRAMATFTLIKMSWEKSRTLLCHNSGTGITDSGWEGQKICASYILQA